MVEGVRSASVAKTDDKKGPSAATKQRTAMDEVAKNVATYLHMEEGGHRMYGYGYFFCQVGIHFQAYWKIKR